MGEDGRARSASMLRVKGKQRDDCSRSSQLLFIYQSSQFHAYVRS